MATTTRSSTTSGELEKPQSGTLTVAPPPIDGVPSASDGGLARPDDAAVGGVERVQDPRRAERVDAPAGERRRPARAGAAVRLEEARRVACASRPARRWLPRSRRRSRRRRAAPACRGRPPLTAKDDQPGPTARRHSSTGGEADQSVAMRTPCTMPSRSGPRKPGQSAVAAAEAVATPPPSERAQAPRLAGQGFAAAAGAEGSAAARARPQPAQSQAKRTRQEPARARGRPEPAAAPRDSRSSASGSSRRGRR